MLVLQQCTLCQRSWRRDITLLMNVQPCMVLQRHGWMLWKVANILVSVSFFINGDLARHSNLLQCEIFLWWEPLTGLLYFFLTGGLKPNLADLAVFGVLRPIRYLKSGKDMVEHTRIGEWYSRMENAVGEPSRIKA